MLVSGFLRLHVPGSSVGMLHLMEVPRSLREQGHSELQNIEDYVQNQLEVAKEMAPYLVSANFLTP